MVLNLPLISCSPTQLRFVGTSLRTLATNGITVTLIFHIIIILPLWEFFLYQRLLVVFQWSLSDTQVSRTLLRILAVLNNAVVWMVSARPLISKSSSSGSNPLVTVPSAPITIDITATFMFHRFFSSLARYRYLSLFSLSYSFTQWPAGMAKFTIRQALFFCWLSVGLVVWLKLDDPFVSQNPRVCASHSRGHLLGRAFTFLFAWSNLNFLHNSYWIAFLTQSCLVLYYYYYYHYFTLLRVFHTSVSWCFLTVVWVTASILKFPGLFSLFCPILTML